MQQGLKVRGRFAIDGHGFSCPRMYKLEMRGMQRNARNTPLRRLLGMILSVADDGMAERRKLHTDLILQSCHQGHPDQRSAAKKPFDRIAKFGSRRFRVARTSQLLEHPFLPKVVNERPIFGLEVPAHDGEILPDRSVFEKLLHQRLAICPGLGKQQDSGGVAIDAMDDKDPLFLFSLAPQKEATGRRRAGVLRRHSQKLGRFVKGNDGIVFVEHGKIVG